MSIKCIGFAIDLKPAECGLTATEKDVLVQLTYRADEESGESHPSLSYISERTGHSTDTVRRSIRSLAEKGWVVIEPRARENGSTTSNLYIADLDRLVVEYRAQKAREQASRVAAQTVASGGKPSAEGPLHGATPPLHGATPPLAPCHPQKESELNNNLSTRERASEAESWKAVHESIIEAAGDAVDSASPNVVSTYPLRLLLTERENSPACTVEELIEGVRLAGEWYRKRGHLIRNWDTVVRFVCELRDKRLQGVPVKALEKPKPAGGGFGDPSTWGRDDWAKVLRLAIYHGEWKAEWGPEPGTDGCGCPRDLIGQWTERAAR